MNPAEAAKQQPCAKESKRNSTAIHVHRSEEWQMQKGWERADGRERTREDERGPTVGKQLTAAHSLDSLQDQHYTTNKGLRVHIWCHGYRRFLFCDLISRFRFPFSRYG